MGSLVGVGVTLGIERVEEEEEVVGVRVVGESERWVKTKVKEEKREEM